MAGRFAPLISVQHIGQMQIHLRQAHSGFREYAPALLHEIVAAAASRSASRESLVRPERNFQQSIGVQLNQATDLSSRRSFGFRRAVFVSRAFTDTLPTRLFQNVVYGDPINSGGLHAKVRIRQCFSQAAMAFSSAVVHPELRTGWPYSAGGTADIVGFVAISMPSSSGCITFGEVFAMDLGVHLACCLPGHLGPMVLRWMVGGSFVCYSAWISANLSCANSTWLAPGAENYTISPAGSGSFSFSGQRPRNLHNRQNRSHAPHRQDASKENAALAVEPGCASGL